MDFHGTTILGVKRNGKTVICGDGQVTMGETVFKGNAKKVRRLGEGKVISGFAGSVADALALYERFEGKYKSAHGNLMKAAVELTKEWRMDKALRRLEALLLVADKENIFLISGNGEVMEPQEDAIAIGSGGPYAYAAAMALLRNTDLDAEEIAKKAIEIAGEICIYTNDNITMEIIE
ncbi:MULTISPECIES: ATP-dependent protease subunit HslV [Petrotoga]|uniref:ATP-dependent protease subunit HslV n=2 Tax=Petrotoga sibirica TaxID=156202 RepID=A0A4R8F1M2_9BACT|nr:MULTISPECIES: ATP-dependent protease subunit HslV [Petrotoga]KUK83926.1 MAG: ATP-dependent protease subunit HslV [Petrotoga mobilis]POZ88004.1 peptidase [Petrotoga sibirica DSM 13575]POZ90094.1 peptidase [Petrotoga sp. SL27]TDX17088.1 ATP dependent peptidase CodWX CodW component [Petrotoga sibirica]